MSSEVSTSRQCAVILLMVLGFTSLIQTGCTSPMRRLGIVDELAIAYRDQVWAKRAYNLRFANCDREFSDHFRNGFCAGYGDVSNGGDGYVPALPPDNYRGYEYQCAEGSRCVSAWFDGYPEGVAAARAEDAGSYHEMQISRMIGQAVTQEKTPNVLPSDVPVTKPRAPQIPRGTVAAKAFGAKFKPVLPTASSPRQNVASRKSFADTVTPPKARATERVARANTLPATSVLTPKLPAAPSVPVASLPPASKPVKLTPPPITRPASTVSQPNALPPIIQGTSGRKFGTAIVPPVIRGQKIDPSTSVSNREIPLPMAVRSTFDTRTAAWPTNRR